MNSHENLTKITLFSTLIAFIYTLLTTILVIDYSLNTNLLMIIPMFYPLSLGTVLLYMGIKEKDNKTIYLSVLHMALPIVIYALLSTIYTALSVIFFL